MERKCSRGINGLDVQGQIDWNTSEDGFEGNDGIQHYSYAIAVIIPVDLFGKETKTIDKHDISEKGRRNAKKKLHR